MADGPNSSGSADAAPENGRAEKLLFWGCFIALITTAFGFITRMFLVNEWSAEFSLDSAQAGRLLGIGVWPFAVSIIFFSLVIDKIGYKASMYIAFVGHMIWSVMGVTAYFVSQNGNPDAAFQMIYWGSLILALANGTVEAFINPVVATMFNREKTKWLNILHAGWPGGLVIAGMILIFMGDAAWGFKVGVIALPTIAYLLMLIPRKFPVHERVASGVSYREMLSEFGILGALVVGFLVTLQLIDFYSVGGEVELSTFQRLFFVLIGVAIVVGFGVYTRSLGRPLMFLLVLIMMPLATTELGTDGWITGIMEGVAEEGGFHAGWVLVYTSVIMMVLRFYAGPIIHAFSPLGTLMLSALLAIIGLLTLSASVGIMIFVTATLYAVGKSFLWPTMLGVVAEQTPKGGALTLNAIAGIGMLTVGTLGFPYIGALQADRQIEGVVNSEVADQVPGLVVDGELQVTERRAIYEIIRYDAIDMDQIEEMLADLPEDQQEEILAGIGEARDDSNQGALATMAMFPAVMLVAYIGLFLYFRSKGGYQAEVLTGEEPSEKEATFAGGVEGPVE